MKKLLIIILLFISFQSFSQQRDTILKLNGSILECDVMKVSDSLIYFSKMEQYHGKDTVNELPRIKLIRVKFYKNNGVWYNNNKEKIQRPQIVVDIVEGKLPFSTIQKKVVFRQIINLDSTYKSDKIFSIVKEWFSTNSKNFNRSNSEKNGNFTEVFWGLKDGNSGFIDQLYKNDQPLKFQNLDDKKLVGKCVLKYTGRELGCVRIIYLEYDVIILVKDYKLKIDITNLNYTHYNQVTMKQVQIFGFNDNGPCSSKSTIENLLNCEKCPGELDTFYTYIKQDMSDIMQDLKKYLENNKNINNDF